MKKDELVTEQSTLRELSLFAGAGGGILGGGLLGWKTVCAVENDPYAASVLVHRQNDKTLPAFPIWDDCRTFDPRPWKGCFDILSAGFPCQDISAANPNAKGIEGERSSLFSEVERILFHTLPPLVWLENSPLLTKRGGSLVASRLASLGYDTIWGVISASHAGACHKRDRIWIIGHLANAHSSGGEQDWQQGELWSEGLVKPPQDCGVTRSTKDGKESQGEENVVNAHLSHGERGELSSGEHKEDSYADTRGSVRWWDSDPADETFCELGRVANALPHRIHRLRCLGNAQVPAAMALAWRTLMQID